MGVRTYINLPYDTAVLDVARIIGLLSGLKPDYRTAQNTAFVEIFGFSIEPGLLVGSAIIRLTGDLVDGESSHRVTFWYENDDYGEFTHWLGTPSTCYWLAIGKRLVEFFGGVLVFQDRCPKICLSLQRRRPQLDRDNSEQFNAFEELLLGTKPLTPWEIAAMRPYAAYPGV